ncbi:hypothetical protein [Patulibacter minatonensis]|uniref:hypothetical protein n=1 Tax=Patulibacter minatonensis TaxID=298163 RepID=UPI00047C0C2F|nr:hypothetical protein [Patulibacter minatonensis]
MTPVHQVRDPADGLSAVGPLARAAELELRLREEALRRERAEARAQNAEAMAEVASARVALLEARAAATAGARAADVRERDAMIATLRRGLHELGGELDAVRAVAVRHDRQRATAAEAPRIDAVAVRSRSALDPSIRMGELARGARELLAGGRLEAADEVIRGLEDAAERLRAQAPPAPEGA